MISRWILKNPIGCAENPTQWDAIPINSIHLTGGLVGDFNVNSDQYPDLVHY